MGEKRHKIAVFIGRFQPFHAGHNAILKDIGTTADAILMLVGSAYRPRSWKNPFSYQDRVSFIMNGMEGVDVPVHVLPLLDTLYNDRAWGSHVRSAVRLYLQARGIEEGAAEIVLTGFDKDASSRYLKWFPEWRMAPVEATRDADGNILNATDLREALFFPGTSEEFGRTSYRFGNAQIGPVLHWMKANPGVVEDVQAEGGFLRDYRQRIAAAEDLLGYPIPINTADAVVVQSGHILLVQRGEQPGKGTLALPGGHIEPVETSFEAAVRELRQETRLKVPAKMFPNRLKDRKVFDHPARSERGWVRTEAFHFVFEDAESLEPVKGGDDAARATWVPLSEVMPDRMFEDHYDIIQSFVPEIATSYASILMPHLGQIR